MRVSWTTLAQFLMRLSQLRVTCASFQQLRRRHVSLYPTKTSKWSGDSSFDKQLNPVMQTASHEDADISYKVLPVAFRVPRAASYLH
uniref:Putative secreted protein n=1 Tax=Amblyomma tuberculatum TaxID=48802 RepID=A0A6M2E0L4_9ACAR